MTSIEASPIRQRFALTSSIEDTRLCFSEYCATLNIHLPDVEQIIMSYIIIIKVQHTSICTGYYVNVPSKPGKRKGQFNHYNFKESQICDKFIPHSFESPLNGDPLIPAITEFACYYGGPNIRRQIFCKDGKIIHKITSNPLSIFDLRTSKIYNLHVLDLKATPVGRQYTYKELYEYLHGQRS
jgi:hypothetical protein